MTSKTKIFLLAGVAIVALSGGFIWQATVVPSYAAEGQDDHGHGEDNGHGGEEEHIRLTEMQIEAAGIKISTIGAGMLSREVHVPGKVVTAADRMAQIVPKVGGVVVDARKNLGDFVEKGEVIAIIESREMAEAVAEQLAAKRAEELARTTFNREKGLWSKNITAEQDYLNAKNAHQEAVIRLDLAKQKLQALGHEGDIDPKGNARFHEMKSPLSGRIIGRELTLGEYVDATHTAYTVADLSVVWIETAIAPGDIPFVQEGQFANIANGSTKTTGKLIFVSPVIDPETRSAKAIIQLDNPDGSWRPGAFVNAVIATSAQKTALSIPKEAVQTMAGKSIVFVRNSDGFEKREITVGRVDSQHIEILSGLEPEESIAISKTFTLKAELGKSEAEHEH